MVKEDAGKFKQNIKEMLRKMQLNEITLKILTKFRDLDERIEDGCQKISFLYGQSK